MGEFTRVLKVKIVFALNLSHFLIVNEPIPENVKVKSK